jgi:hypothetical protein
MERFRTTGFFGMNKFAVLGFGGGRCRGTPGTVEASGGAEDTSCGGRVGFEKLMGSRLASPSIVRSILAGERLSFLEESFKLSNI